MEVVSRKFKAILITDLSKSFTENISNLNKKHTK